MVERVTLAELGKPAVWEESRLAPLAKEGTVVMVLTGATEGTVQAQLVVHRLQLCTA
jgi:glycine cleavage system regulatory protein